MGGRVGSSLNLENEVAFYQFDDIPKQYYFITE